MSQQRQQLTSSTPQSQALSYSQQLKRNLLSKTNPSSSTSYDICQLKSVCNVFTESSQKTKCLNQWKFCNTTQATTDASKIHNI